jgi:hypothetical protein
MGASASMKLPHDYVYKQEIPNQKQCIIHFPAGVTREDYLARIQHDMVKKLPNVRTMLNLR